jgi:hypothetical protein
MHASDGGQRPLVPRSRCPPRLMPGVRLLEAGILIQRYEVEAPGQPAKHWLTKVWSHGLVHGVL